MPYYCEVCGIQVNEPLRPINYYGEKLLACQECTKTTARGAAGNNASSNKAEDRSHAGQATHFRGPKVSSRGSTITDYDLQENYSKQIKENRERLGLTLQDLASKIGIKESIMRRVEAGKYEPDVETAKKIEKYLRINLLIKWEEPKRMVIASENKENLELRHVAKLRESDE